MGSSLAGFEGAPEGSSRLEGAGMRSTDGLATSRVKRSGERLKDRLGDQRGGGGVNGSR
jgi:hypothetical protein